MIPGKGILVWAGALSQAVVLTLLIGISMAQAGSNTCPRRPNIEHISQQRAEQLMREKRAQMIEVGKKYYRRTESARVRAGMRCACFSLHAMCNSIRRGCFTCGLVCSGLAGVAEDTQVILTANARARRCRELSPTSRVDKRSSNAVVKELVPTGRKIGNAGSIASVEERNIAARQAQYTACMGFGYLRFVGHDYCCDTALKMECLECAQRCAEWYNAIVEKACT